MPVKVIQTGGLNRDGSPKRTVIFNGKCFFSEKSKTKLTAEKQLITLSGELLFNGDIFPDNDIITGEVEISSGIRRVIFASEKCRNPDGTVNYTRLKRWCNSTSSEPMTDETADKLYGLT